MMNEKLLTLREKIDNIDSQIFDLLMKRVKVVEEVGELKRSHCETSSIIRSGREAKMIRQIFTKCKDLGFEDKIAYGFANLWRQIICVSINIEQNTAIACHNERTQLIAKEYFGNFIKPRAMENGLESARALSGGIANIAVVETETVAEEAPWWLWLSQNQEYKVFATLPFISGIYRDIFAIAKTDPEQTEFDESLYVTDIKSESAEIISEYEGKFLVKVPGYKPVYDGLFIGSYSIQF